MNRNRWLFLLVAFLLVANIVWIIYSRWGLITVHANGQPLSQVIRTIERQGGITLRTDLEPTTPVTMNVNRVPLSEALETLATVTESRWRLTYLVGPTHGDVTNALATVSAGQKMEGWKTLFVPLPQTADDDLMPADPRRDHWEVKEPAEKTAQAYLDQGAKSVSASFMFPKDWNPAVAGSLSSGPVRKVVPKLAKLAHGDEQEVFLLLKSRRRADFADDGGGGPRDWMGDRDAMDQRMQAELAKMSPEKRAEMQAEIDERKQFFQSLADLPPEERRAKAEEFFQQPKVEEKMEQRQLNKDSRLSPEQRVARAQSYAQRRQDFRSGGTQK